MKKLKVNFRVAEIIVFIFFFFCWIPSLTFGQNRSTITGYVFTTQRRVVSDVQVELINGFDSVIQRVKTDGSGRFFFSGVPSGRLAVRVLPLGTDFEEQTQEVEVGGTGLLGRPLTDYVQLDFYLRTRRSSVGAATNGVVFFQEIPEEAKKIYENAVTDLDSKKIDSAVEKLTKALELFPNYYAALEKLGLTYINQQKYEDARDIFTRAVTVNSRSFNGWYGLSYANYSLKQSEAAIDAAQKAISLNPNSIDAILFLGISQRQAKYYQEAEKSLKQAEKISKGNSADVHWHLALLYAHNLNRYKDAADELELYLKVNANTPNSESIKKLIKQYREKTLD